MREDPIYTYSPRWLEESGLPHTLNENFGVGAWNIFKKLTEFECEQNLLPNWFTLSIDDLVEWTGINEKSVQSFLISFEINGYIQRRKITARTNSMRLRFPRSLAVPRSKEEIADRLKEQGWKTNHLHWRYLEPPRFRKAERKVLHLYQQLFGTRMNDRIAADLVETAQTFDYSAIEEAFQEAKKNHAKTLNWIICHLYQGVEDEQVSKIRRRAQDKKNTRRTASHG